MKVNEKVALFVTDFEDNLNSNSDLLLVYYYQIGRLDFLNSLDNLKNLLINLSRFSYKINLLCGPARFRLTFI